MVPLLSKDLVLLSFKDDEVKETSTSPKVIDGNDEPTRKAAKSNGGEVNENEKETKTEEEQNKKETMEE